MKKYYALTLFAILMLIFLQVYYIATVYSEYHNRCKNEINDIIYTCIDREKNIRTLLKNGEKKSDRFLNSYELDRKSVV